MSKEMPYWKVILLTQLTAVWLLRNAVMTGNLQFIIIFNNQLLKPYTQYCHKYCPKHIRVWCRNMIPEKVHNVGDPLMKMQDILSNDIIILCL